LNIEHACVEISVTTKWSVSMCRSKERRLYRS